VKLFNIIYRITHKNKKIKKKDIDTKQKLRHDKNATRRYHTETNTRTGVKNMNEKIYYSAEDIAKMLGVSMGKAYKILREMNKDLASKGFLTIAGKIPVEYFKEKWYGGAKEVSA
jgi:putative transcriptional regulator